MRLATLSCLGTAVLLVALRGAGSQRLWGRLFGVQPLKLRPIRSALRDQGVVAGQRRILYFALGLHQHLVGVLSKWRYIGDVTDVKPLTRQYLQVECRRSNVLAVVTGETLITDVFETYSGYWTSKSYVKTHNCAAALVSVQTLLPFM
jgi:hypothetical protein